MNPRGGNAGRPAPHSPVPHLARPALGVGAHFIGPPRIRSNPQAYGATCIRFFFSKIKISLIIKILFLLLKN